jgi:hypothetical protein
MQIPKYHARFKDTCAQRLIIRQSPEAYGYDTVHVSYQNKLFTDIKVAGPRQNCFRKLILIIPVLDAGVAMFPKSFLLNTM